MGSLDRITSILLVNHPADTRPSWSAGSFLPYDDSDQPPSPHLYQRSRKGRKGYDSISYDHTHHVIHVQVHISLTAGSSKWLVHSHDTPTQHTRHVPSVRRERERPRGTLGGHRSHHVVSYVHWCTIVSLHMCVYMYLCMYTIDSHMFWISSSSLHHTYIHGVATSQRRHETQRHARHARPPCLPACMHEGWAGAFPWRSPTLESACADPVNRVVSLACAWTWWTEVTLTVRTRTCLYTPCCPLIPSG